jgi:hypothetical protein
MKECDNSKIHISSNFILSISLLIMFDTLLLRLSLHCNIPLHFTQLHFTPLRFTSDTDVCAPDDGWWYHPKHVEQFPDINKLCKVAYCWIYIRILEQTTCVKTSWTLTNTNPTWMVTDGDEPRENSLSSSVMDLWFLKLIPLAILSSRCSYGDEVFFPTVSEFWRNLWLP